MFQINDLSVTINDQTILSHIHYTQESKGKIIGILGPNGAGKSTLIKSILGFTPHTGDAYWDNKSIKANKSLCSYVPQKSTVDLTFPITVEHVILSGLYNGKLNMHNHNGMYKVNQLLIQFELSQYRNRTLDTLSGGQLQRVLLARSLMQDKMIYFLDEPFVGIDFKSYEIIKHCIFELKNEDKLIFIVHHDLNTAASLFDEIIMLNKKIIASGPTETTLTQDNLAKTFFNSGGMSYV
ncbi:metal ABC transporter ATP-binding protein [Macrococcoides caseolyticum]|uniref:metal ABC transporter ATP-binding protein n=1 Tax=Macrococcoides caseolyticum TaxID=69966 RepID=UPI001F3D8FCB|nr:metal ABC transporter ATP-binding protein [Macrococcus caseolyticus]MCE4956553.1 metal ABC transporter ATP-binding protein [Macrococcus caseolyticus]